jgi:hypothetical protein
MNLHVDIGLRLVAVAQLALAIVNLFLVRILKWKPDLERMPLLIREVFLVHSVFIAITLSIFGVLTWRFAHDIASHANTTAVWLAVAIGIFWATRAIMQWTYYSRDHWVADRRRTVIHWVLFLGYGAFAFIYLVASFGKSP